MFREPLAEFRLDAAQIERCEKFYRLVIEQNRVMNLTAITFGMLKSAARTLFGYFLKVTAFDRAGVENFWRVAR